MHEVLKGSGVDVLGRRCNETAIAAEYSEELCRCFAERLDAMARAHRLTT